MTVPQFKNFYPQFKSIIPLRIIRAYVKAANLRFDEFDEDAEEARRLYVAHKLTLYARTMPVSLDEEGGATSYAALSSAASSQTISSKKVDDVSISYTSGEAASSASTGLADLTETTYGLQLLTLLRLHSYPRYVP